MPAEHLVELNYWVAQSVRLTAFPAGLIDSDSVVDWWRDVAGSRPEESRARPREGQLTESGTVALDEGRGVQVQLDVLPIRAEWRIAPPEGEDGQENDQRDGDSFALTSLDEFGRATELIQVVARRWWPMAPPLKRLAFGAVIVHPVDSAEDAYQELSRFVHYPLEREHMSDFLLQVNRPRLARSTSESLQLNRLVKWSSLTIRRVQLSVTGDQIESGQSVERYTVRCELDINTQATRQEPLPVEQLPELFVEMCALASEIAQSGDIA